MATGQPRPPPTPRSLAPGSWGSLWGVGWIGDEGILEIRPPNPAGQRSPVVPDTGS